MNITGCIHETNSSLQAFSATICHVMRLHCTQSTNALTSHIGCVNDKNSRCRKPNIQSPVGTYLVWIDYLTGCYDSAMRFVSSIDLYTVDLLEKNCAMSHWMWRRLCACLLMHRNPEGFCNDRTVRAKRCLIGEVKRMWRYIQSFQFIILCDVHRIVEKLDLSQEHNCAEKH